jgi:type IV pilus assembly protein PilM
MCGCSFEEAEKLKFEMTSSEPIDKIAAQSSDSRSWRVVQPLLDELLREIRRSMHYYQSQFPEGQEATAVSRIVLTGGAARMPGMAAYVDSRLNVPTETGDIFSEGMLTPGQFSREFIDDYGPILVVGSGLALKEEMLRSKTPAAA